MARKNSEKQDLIAVSAPETTTFMGSELKYPPALSKYAAARSTFLPAIAETYQSMVSQFDSNIDSIENFVDNGRDFFVSSIKPLLSFSIKEFATYNCYTFDEDSFFEEFVCVRFDRIADIHEKISCQLQEMRDRQEEINARRKEERHQAVAEGKSELGMMLWNGMKRLGDGVVNSINSSGIYNDQVKKELKDEFWKICMGVLDDFTAALFAANKIDIRNPITMESKRKAHNIFERLKRGDLPEQEMLQLTKEVLLLNPLYKGLLEWCVVQYGDPAGELQHLADLFCIDISKTKDEILRKDFCLDSEAKALATQKYITEMKSKLSYSNPKLEEQVQVALKKFDQKARTFGKVEYSTRAEAKNARKEKEKIDEICKKHSSAHLPQEYDAFLAELQAEKFQYGFDKEIIENIKKKQAEWNQQETVLATHCHISQEKAKVILEQINSLKNFGNKAVKGFLPNSDTAIELKGLCEAAEDDFVVGVIDTSFTENCKKGIILTDKGLYVSRYRSWSIWESCILIIFAVALWPECGFWKWLLALLAIGVFLFFLRKFFTKVKKFFSRNKNNYDFIPWEQAAIRCKGDSSVIELKSKYLFKLPGHTDLSGNRIKLVKLLSQIAESKKEMNLKNSELSDASGEQQDQHSADAENSSCKENQSKISE